MLDLVARTVWGSGGTRYRIRDIVDKLRVLAGWEFVTLNLGNDLVGFYMLRRKQVRIGSSVVKAYYRTFLTVAKEYRGMGYGYLLVEQAKRHFASEMGESGLLYGYVEAENLASLATLKQAGYESIASFSSSIFSRWRPRHDARCRLLRRCERGGMEALLTELYEDHVLLDFDQSLNPESYWVLESSGTIAAGIQVETCNWQIVHLPGASGALLVHGVSRIPFLRRMFDAQQCRFVKFGNLHARPGYESLIFSLMESVLAATKVYSAVIFHDPRSATFERISDSGRFGLLNSGIDTKVHVMASTFGFTKGQEQALRNRPMMISPLDIG
jgi:GNAT superfamily N-acetyltransferase